MNGDDNHENKRNRVDRMRITLISHLSEELRD